MIMEFGVWLCIKFTLLYEIKAKKKNLGNKMIKAVFAHMEELPKRCSLY